MPLLFIKDIDADTRLGLWKIADELHADEVCPQTVCEDLKQKCGRRQQETVAVYALLNAMIGRKGVVIDHNEAGKPMLDDRFISVSHTVGYACVMLSKTKNVAVDIEYRNNRVFRIVDKFLTKYEKEAIDCTSQTELLLCWCAKETTYKYFSEQKLVFEEMQIELKAVENEGFLYCLNQREGTKKAIRYMQNDDFVLTYTL